MTIYSIIEKIYNKYYGCRVDEIDIDSIRYEIIFMIKTKWPDIEFIDEGINLEYNNTTFDVSIDNYIIEEFYQKYPEALI